MCLLSKKTFKIRFQGGPKNLQLLRGPFPQGGTEFSENLRGEKATRGIHHFKGGLKNQAETMAIPSSLSYWPIWLGPN